MKTVEERLSKNPDDKWAIEVKGRLMGMNDLVAEEVFLHKSCNTSFFSERGNQHSEEDRGRKRDKGRVKLFKELCNWLEEEMEDNLFTLDHLHEKLVSLDKTPDKALAYTKRYLKQMLEKHFKERMYFTSEERRTDVLCFKDLTASIIREHHNNKEDDDKTKIIKSAVKLIQNYIALVNMNSSLYPSINEMTDLDAQLKLIPESLKLFLKPLLKQDRGVAFWGQSIIKTSRPRSGVLPLPMRFALQLEHRFGSKRLLDEMHSLGFSKSYHQVSNYKYCYIANKVKVKIQSSNSLETIVEEEEPEDDNIIIVEMLLLDECEEKI